MPQHKLEFDIWQFVRVMVYLEDTGGKNALLTRWGDVWSELDKKLADLAENDFEAYSDLMMNQNVVFHEAGNDDVAQVLKALDGVIVQMKGTLKQKDLDDQQTESLIFEIGELQSLRRSLKLLA